MKCMLCDQPSEGEGTPLVKEGVESICSDCLDMFFDDLAPKKEDASES